MPNHFTNAALAGLLAGVVACGGDAAKTAEKTADHAAEKAKQADASHASAKAQDAQYTGNSCAGTNACKGIGGCKTEKHACKGMNDCKGQGGCHLSGEDQAKLAAKRKGAEAKPAEKDAAH